MILGCKTDHQAFDFTIIWWNENDSAMKELNQTQAEELEQSLLSSEELTAYGMVKLGKLYSSLGRFEEAIGAFSMAMDLEPEEDGF